MKLRWLGRLVKVLVVLGGINFVAWMVISFKMGGTALPGKVEDGHYYLRDRGRYTEVSEEMFWWCRVHAYSVVLGLVAPALAGGVAACLGKEHELFN